MTIQHSLGSPNKVIHTTNNPKAPVPVTQSQEISLFWGEGQVVQMFTKRQVKISNHKKLEMMQTSITIE